MENNDNEIVENLNKCKVMLMDVMEKVNEQKIPLVILLVELLLAENSLRKVLQPEAIEAAERVVANVLKDLQEKEQKKEEFCFYVDKGNASC